jgi:hypothetical protein
MKITVLELVAVLGLFIGVMLPVVAGIIYAIREGKRLDEINQPKNNPPL